MTKYNENDIQYKGETNGVHAWSTPSGQPYYWHPDWLHVAEDATGSHPKQKLEVESSEALDLAKIRAQRRAKGLKNLKMMR